MRSAIVIPTFQEVDNITPLLTSLREHCPELTIFIVDDNSPDGTADMAEKVGEQIGGVEVVRRTGRAGLGVAYRHGFRHALSRGYDVVAQMDADLSHDPAVVPQLLAAIENGADVAVGSRYVPGGNVPQWTWSRRKLSSWGNSYAKKMLRLTFNDATTAFRAYRSEVLDGIDIDGTTANGYLFQIETAFRLSAGGYKVVELPITFEDRAAGSSKMAVGRTMVETELRVTWWALTMRAPKLTGAFRRTPPGRYMESRIRPSNVGKAENLSPDDD